METITVINDEHKFIGQIDVQRVFEIIKKELKIWDNIDPNNILILSGLESVLSGKKETSISTNDHILKISFEEESGNIIKTKKMMFKVYLKFETIKRKFPLITESLTFVQIF